MTSDQIATILRGFNRTPISSPLVAHERERCLKIVAAVHDAFPDNTVVQQVCAGMLHEISMIEAVVPSRRTFAG